MNIDEKKLSQELVKELGLEKLPKDKQELLLDKAVIAVMERIFLESFKRLGETGQREYEALSEDASQEELEAFFEAKIPGYNEFVKKIVEEFKADMKKAEI